jgi:hypothetical protein
MIHNVTRLTSQYEYQLVGDMSETDSINSLAIGKEGGNLKSASFERGYNFMSRTQWRTQEFFSGRGGIYARNFFLVGGVQQIQFNLQMSETHILLGCYGFTIPRSWEFGSTLAKLRNFGGTSLVEPTLNLFHGDGPATEIDWL